MQFVFVIDSLQVWLEANVIFLSIGAMCLNFDVFVTTRARVICMRCIKIVKISQKYIADPLWFSHKSSTGCRYT